MKIALRKILCIVFTIIITLTIGGCTISNTKKVLNIKKIESITFSAGENDYSVNKIKFNEIITSLKFIDNDLLSEVKASIDTCEFRMIINSDKTYEFLFNTLTYLKIDDKLYLVDSDLPKKIFMEAMGKCIFSGILTINDDWIENNNHHIFSIGQTCFMSASFSYPNDANYTYTLNFDTTNQFRNLLNNLEYESFEILDEQLYGGKPNLKINWIDNSDMTINGMIGNGLYLFLYGDDALLMQYALPTDRQINYVIYKLKDQSLQNLYHDVFGANSINYIYDEYDCTKETDITRISMIETTNITHTEY